jgi:hypothetical protein
MAALDSLLAGSDDYPESEEDAAETGDTMAGADPGLDALALGMPGAQSAMELLIKSNSQAREALQRAREKIAARKYNRAIALLAVSGALGAPTRSGSAAEGWANAANALVGPLQAKDAFERSQEKELLGIDTSIAGLDQSTAKAGLDLAMLRARLQAEAAKAGNDIIIDEKGNPQYASHGDARGKPAYTPPPASGFTVFQQPLPNGQSQPMRLNTKTGDVEPAGPAYVPTRLSAQGRIQAQGKLQTTKILKTQLESVKKAWKPLKNSIVAGKYQGWFPSERGEQFDKAVAAMRGTIRQLTRVPGEGSMSDWEGKIDQAKLPDRNEYEEVTEQSIEQLEDLIKVYEETTKEMLGATASGAPTLRFDKSGKPIQ